MFPFELSLFGIGLMMIVIVFVVLYLIVLIKLKPSNEGKKITKKDASKQRIMEENLTERQVKPEMYDEVEEETVEPVERQEIVETIEMQETVPPAPVETAAPVETGKVAVNGCPHYLGYLREHPKNTPLPNECLTCPKIIECLSKVE